MTGSTLIAHNPRFESKLVTLEQLKALPEPEPLGLRHKPVPHAQLVEGILAEVERRELVPVRTQLALGAKGHALFGVMDLQKVGVEATGERGVSFGFRSSTNSSLAIKAVAGTRVFVCDNLALSGDMIAFLKKSTIGLDFKDMIAHGFDQFAEHVTVMDLHIAELGATALSDGEAKQRIFDVFNAGIMPVRLFDDVARIYFQPTEDMTDVQPRTLWGLHNAFTRAARDLGPGRLFNATVQLGRMFGMTADRLVEGEVVED